jgi:uncharacterized membrane protein (DUF441 family)
MTHPEMVRVVVEVVGALLRLKNPVVEVVLDYMDREPVVMLERTIVTEGIMLPVARAVREVPQVERLTVTTHKGREVLMAVAVAVRAAVGVFLVQTVALEECVLCGPDRQEVSHPLALVLHKGVFI